MQNYATVILGMAICLAALALYAYPLCYPMILYDDFQMLVPSLTWSTAWANVWVPANEHAMPLGRLSTWALVQLAGRPTAYPAVLALQGPLALLLTLGLLYQFVRRELGHPLYGLTAVALFGITSVYLQAVSWFAASFSVLALAGLLLALLAAQRWRQTGRGHHLVLSTVWAALAPAWFASGILAGPLCCLYLLSAERQRTRRSALLVLPLVGSAAFLAVSLPLTADQIMHLEHYDGKTAWQSFHPAVGLLYTGRSLVDNLALGVLGISGVHCPPALVPVGLLLLSGAMLWWWRPVAERRLLWLGMGLILCSYLLVYSARAEWSYEGVMNQPNWSRYHLLPQLGLALLVCGGLPRWQGHRLHLDATGHLSYPQIRALGLLLGALWLIQLPRALIAPCRYDPEQQETLRRIEDMEERCATAHIAAEVACAALEKLPVPYGAARTNGWQLLRGSADPWPVSVAEARRLLTGAE